MAVLLILIQYQSASLAVCSFSHTIVNSFDTYPVTSPYHRLPTIVSVPTIFTALTSYSE